MTQPPRPGVIFTREGTKIETEPQEAQVDRMMREQALAAEQSRMAADPMMDQQARAMGASVRQLPSFIGYLGPMAQDVYGTIKTETLLQLPNLDVSQPRWAVARYMSKPCPLSPGGYIDETFIRRFALAFNEYVEDGMVGYGVLSQQAFWMPAGGGLDWSSGLAVPKAPDKAVMCLYTFSEHTNEDLNDYLGVDLFVPEGGVANEDWTEMPT